LDAGCDPAGEFIGKGEGVVCLFVGRLENVAGIAFSHFSEGDAFPAHGAGERRGRLGFSFPLVVGENHDVHGQIEVRQFLSGGNGTLIAGSGGIGDNGKKIDIAVGSGGSACVRSEQPDLFRMHAGSELIGHLACDWFDVHGEQCFINSENSKLKGNLGAWMGAVPMVIVP